MHKNNNETAFKDAKVALVYDHLTTSFGGAELVLQTLQSIFPDAPIFTSVYDIRTNDWAKSSNVRTSFLQKIPFIRKYHQLLAPLHPLAFESFDLSEFDIILSVSNGASKGVVTLPHQLHLCYMLNPTRYLTLSTHDLRSYIKSQPILSLPGVSVLLTPFFHYLRRWDNIAAQRPDVVIAISKLVASRIEEQYQRSADNIIYPPYRLSNLDKTSAKLPPFLLCLTRLASYKRIDLAVSTAVQSNAVLVVAGEGVEKSRLIKLAKNKGYQRVSGAPLSSALSQAANEQKNIVFLGVVSEQEKHLLLESCTALLMPGEEDFGLVGLEAAAYGKPIVTYYKSGIAEVLKDGKQAIHTTAQTVESLEQALRRLSKTSFDPKAIATSIQEYEAEWFKELFHKTIYHFWQQHSTIAPVKNKSKYHTK